MSALSPQEELIYTLVILSCPEHALALALALSGLPLDGFCKYPVTSGPVCHMVLVVQVGPQ